MKTTVLHETVSLEGAVLNHEAYTVRQRVIVAGTSLNGRHYPAGVLQEAAPKLAGVRTFANHGAGNRGVREITGYLTAPEYDAGDNAIYATRHVVGEARQWLWPLIVEVVEGRAPNLVGCSISAIGTGEKTDEGLTVTRIEQFHSVDDVTDPAAGGGFVALAAGVDDTLARALLDALDFDDWREARPEFVEQLQKEWKTIRQSQAVKAAQADADRLQAALSALQEQYDGAQAELAMLREQAGDARDALSADLTQARRQLAIVRALAGTRLPVAWRDDLEARLLEADDSQWASIIEREQHKATMALRQRVPVSGAGASIAPTVQMNAPTSASPLPRDNEDFASWQRRTQGGK